MNLMQYDSKGRKDSEGNSGSSKTVKVVDVAKNKIKLAKTGCRRTK